MDNKWNVRRKQIDKFFKLSNNQWLKIVFDYKSLNNSWCIDIVVSNSKRKCNDCMHKTEFSPKVIYGRTTGNKLGLEALLLAKRELLKFETRIHDTQIRVFGANKRLISIYERALRKYNYKTFTNERGRKYLVKEVL